jgi:hypothetical protein
MQKNTHLFCLDDILDNYFNQFIWKVGCPPLHMREHGRAGHDGL